MYAVENVSPNKISIHHFVGLVKRKQPTEGEGITPPCNFTPKVVEYKKANS